MKHSLNNTAVCLLTRIRIEEVALESDVHSHYYTAGDWRGITLSRSGASKIVLIMVSHFRSRPEFARLGMAPGYHRVQQTKNQQNKSH